MTTKLFNLFTLKYSIARLRNALFLGLIFLNPSLFSQVNLEENIYLEMPAVFVNDVEIASKLKKELNLQLSSILKESYDTVNSKKMAINPVVCQNSENTVLYIQFIDLRKQLITASQSFILGPKNLKNFNFRALANFKEEIENAYQNYDSEKLLESTRAVFDVKPHSFFSSRDICLVNSIVERFQKQFVFSQVLNTEQSHYLNYKFSLNFSPPVRRPTRHFDIGFSDDKNKDQKDTMLVRMSETVLGQQQQSQKATRLDSKKIDEFMSAIEGYFTANSKSLVRADQPVISKLYGRWAYVDRGRAWGLRLDDRVISRADTNTKNIKGHVVAYFGADLKIKSPRGFVIDEGAIIYLRENRQAAKIGLEFEVDKETFPKKSNPR